MMPEIDKANQEVEQEMMTRLGITRVQTDSYLCGQYRYTNLQDAIAQGERNELAKTP
jgi:hypothetical protein